MLLLALLAVSVTALPPFNSDFASLMDVDDTSESMDVSEPIDIQTDTTEQDSENAMDVTTTYSKKRINPQHVSGPMYLHSTSNPNSASIVGGKPATPFKYPWMASLQEYKDHFCGGILLNPTTLVTAAHCSVETDPEVATVNLHRHDLSKKMTEEKGLRVKVLDIIIHPGYENNDTFYNAFDVAIWKLDIKPKQRKQIEPFTINLDDGSALREGNMLTIAGWGKRGSRIRN
jgi:Trypsin